jgi:hypothetical protein
VIIEAREGKVHGAVDQARSKTIASMVKASSEGEVSRGYPGKPK